MSLAGAIDLLYADESGFCSEGYVPYGWQFKAEQVSVPVDKSLKSRLNCFAMISRDNRCHWSSTTGTINGEWLMQYLERFSLALTRKTVLVLDCAALHRCKVIKERMAVWRKRGLWLFYLPPYSPHLNICETLWRMMKGLWIAPEDYRSVDTLHYATLSVLRAVGREVRINYQHFNSN